MIKLSPEVAELVPAIGGLFAAGCGWALIFYTRYTRRAARLREEKHGAE